MKRYILPLVLLLGLSPGLQGADACLGPTPAVEFMAFEEISVSSTSIGFTAGTIKPDTGLTGAIYAYCTVEDDAIRYREDGIAPTATVGHPVAVDTAFSVCGERTIKNFRMIRQTTDADVNCTYYKAR